MRLHRLDIEGFGPFLRRQTIDFDDYAADGLFLISGKTGSGKSSILDAVCFALYGSVPRHSDAAKRVRSDHALVDDLSEVVLEFTTAENTYRITRSPEYERPKRRGEGTTIEAPRVLLERCEGDAWVGIAARAVDAGLLLDDILHLSKEQFLQVILLAQNSFSKFLLAKNDERLTLLRTLFGTKRFEDYQKALEERRRESERSQNRDSAIVEERISEAERFVEAEGLGPKPAGPGVTGGSGQQDEAPREQGAAAEQDAAAPLSVATRLEELRRAIARGAYRVQSLTDSLAIADRERVSAADSLAIVRADRDKQVRRDAARIQLDQLEERIPAVTTTRATVAGARSAQLIRGVLEQAEQATRALADSAAVRDHAAVAWDEARHDGDAVSATVDVERLEAIVTESSMTLGSLADAQSLEAQLPELDRAVQLAQDDVDSASAAQDALATEAASLPELIVQHQSRILELTSLADQEPARKQRFTDIETKRNAAMQIEGKQRDYDDAVRASASANAASISAAQHLEALYRRKLDGFASELASTLASNDACPVCGSTEHPQLAAASVDPVTADDLDGATIERDTKAVEASKASGREKAAAAALAAVEAASGGDSLDELAAAYAEAKSLLAQSHDARGLADTERELLEAVHVREQDITARRAALQANREQTSARLVAASERKTAAIERVAAARGEFESVADRAESLRGYRSAAENLATAAQELARATKGNEAAESALADSIAESAFGSAEEVRQALLPEKDVAALEAQVLEFDGELRVVRATLLELELATLSEEPIDIEAPTHKAEQAQQVWARIGRERESAAQSVALITARTEAASVAYGEQAAAEERHEAIVRLADTVAGRQPNTMRMSLETFVLAAELEEIVNAANVRLKEMSSGRYRLQHSDERAARGGASGLGIDVFDTFTSKSRPAASLSGGETFLASLSLALGLAEVVTSRAGGVRLDTLFVDEGFGSLDADTLDVAMRTLDELRTGGRTVGVISHVEAMKEQIPAQIRVAVAPDGSSDIESR